MGRAIIWMVALLVVSGLICAVVAVAIAAISGAGASKKRRRYEEQQEMARLEQERIEFLRREGRDF